MPYINRQLIFGDFIPALERAAFLVGASGFELLATMARTRPHWPIVGAALAFLGAIDLPNLGFGEFAAAAGAF